METMQKNLNRLAVLLVLTVCSVATYGCCLGNDYEEAVSLESNNSSDFNVKIDFIDSKYSNVKENDVGYGTKDISRLMNFFVNSAIDYDIENIDSPEEIHACVNNMLVIVVPDEEYETSWGIHGKVTGRNVRIGDHPNKNSRGYTASAGTPWCFSLGDCDWAFTIKQNLYERNDAYTAATIFHEMIHRYLNCMHGNGDSNHNTEWAWSLTADDINTMHGSSIMMEMHYQDWRQYPVYNIK